MKHIVILTEFGSPDPSYSLNIVVEEQLNMLLRAGYSVTAIVQAGFQPERIWKDVDLRHIPAVPKPQNRVEFPSGWEKGVDQLEDVLEVALADADIVIGHDIIYQAAALWVNIAARRVAQANDKIKWLHWVHSATASEVWKHSVEGINTHFPNSLTVFPNEYSQMRVATNFNCEVDQVAYVPHSTNIADYLGLDRLVQDMIDAWRLFEADIIMTYPVRLDRGKQVEHVLRVAAGLKQVGLKPRVIVADFHSTGGDKVAYRDWLKQHAVDLGLIEGEYAFVSEFHDSLKASAPRHIIRDLMLLSNVFVMPSRSETYSLITQEAALCSNLLVLNFDFPPMRNIYGEKAAYYKFSSNIDANTGLDGETNVEYSDPELYFRGIALRIKYELENNFLMNQAWRVRTTRNPDFVFKKYLEPLFYSWDG